jgi:hypothetical protein
MQTVIPVGEAFNRAIKTGLADQTLRRHRSEQAEPVDLRLVSREHVWLLSGSADDLRRRHRPATRGRSATTSVPHSELGLSRDRRNRFQQIAFDRAVREQHQSERRRTWKTAVHAALRPTTH